MPDASFTLPRIEFAKTLRFDSQTWRKIDFAASHPHNFQSHITNMDDIDGKNEAFRKAGDDKLFLAIRPQIASCRFAFYVGQLYRRDTTFPD